ncbi:hypothetical protein CNYM01_14064 [Colletotrichum nymphaeae SA-01]|uniref:AB hydrolase-1 domain-containing protein n=1 Tax=Colletotrichum nymphaeae SA-01 TaxID=1460502 RepID=A0A135RVW9_9PEZI|nr:hypothetical protein CNYM01_14064 [Colletotrichum nymphaeae SA-01]
MLGKSFYEYVVVRMCVVLLQHPVAFYIAGLATCLIGGNFGRSRACWGTATFIVLSLMSIESAYALFIWRPYTKRLKEPARHPALSSTAERRALFDRCMATIPSFDHYLCMWFLGAELSEIRRDNIREFLLWAFFDVELRSNKDKHTSRDYEDYSTEVDQYIAHIEFLWGRPFESGRGRAKCLRLTIDSIETKYRTVWWYAIVALLDIVTHVLLSLKGFEYYAQPPEKSIFPPRIQQLFASRRSPAESLSYWHRHHQSDGLPVVFFHGIGLGLWPYVRFLGEISATGNGRGQTGIIAIEVLPICFRLTDPPLDKEAFLRQLKGILHYHTWERFTLVSHSYGSILSTHAIKCPEFETRIPAVVLIDPVSILLHLPDVAYNFTRRQPKTAIELLLWYFASTDPGVAHCLGRYFFWRENAIWADELTGRSISTGFGGSRHSKPRQVAICLAAFDLIIDSHSIARYLAEGDRENCLVCLQGKQAECEVAGPQAARIQGMDHKQARFVGSDIDVLWFHDKDHGQVFQSQRERKKIVAVIRDYCKVNEISSMSN